jgi:hypothetical protein
VNLGPVSQSLILAGESREVDLLVTRATQVLSGTAGTRQMPVPEREQGIAIQSQTVDNQAPYSNLQDPMAGRPGRSAVDLYRRVQRANSPKASAQILDVFA